MSGWRVNKLFVVCMVTACLLPNITLAQQKPTKVGWLMARTTGPFSELTHRSFEQGLREAGFSEGKNLTLVRRSAEDDLNRLPALANDLVKQNVDVIFAPSKVLLDAAWYAGRKIPTVIATVADLHSAWVPESVKRRAGVAGV